MSSRSKAIEMGKLMPDNDQDIRSDSSGNTVRFRSGGTHPLPPSAGKAVTVTGPTAAPVVHGTVNNSTLNASKIVFDNPA